ncbi:unnamed protein product [Trichobilharzia regenti]|nr:unnamed protein product [Trichobilharzia regenti]
MCPNRITYSHNYLKCFQPDDLRVNNNLKKKHYGGRQRSLKCTPMHQMTVSVIMSTNSRSLPNKIDYLHTLLYSNVYCNTGVITLHETWLHDSYDDNSVSLSGFTMYRQDRCSSKKKRSSGVATFIKTQWSTADNVCFKISNENIDCITVKRRPKHLSKYSFIFVTNIYIAPCCSPSPSLSIFADELNIFAASSFCNSLSISTLLGHANVVIFPTRRNTSLDLVFINDFAIYEARKRAPLFNSDHFIVRVLPKITQ